MRIHLIIILLFTGSSVAVAQKPVWNFDDFQARVLQENDTIYVAAFWATWCKPCVAELPYFENQQSEFKSKPVKIILVSLDFKKDLIRMTEFSIKKGLKNEIALLSAGNPDIWIDKVATQWSGAIPATAFFKNKNLIHFYEGEFTNELLNSTIINLLQND